MSRNINKLFQLTVIMGMLMISPLLVKAQTTQDNNVIVIRLSHVDKANSITGKAAILFKEKLEAKFPNKVKVSVFEEGHLFKAKEEKEALDLGAVDIIVPSTDSIVDNYKIKEFEVFDLPFLFNNKQEVQKFITSSTSQKLLNSLNSSSSNSIGLAYWPQGFKNFEGSKPFKSVADLNQQSEKPTDNETKNVFFKTFGITLSDNPTLREKTTENFLNSENITQWLTESHHLYSTDVMIANKKWFNELPPNIQQGITDIAHETSAYALENTENIDSSKQLKDKHVQVYQLSDAEKESFKKSVISVHANFLNNINKNFLLEVYQVIRQK